MIKFLKSLFCKHEKTHLEKTAWFPWGVRNIDEICDICKKELKTYKEYCPHKKYKKYTAKDQYENIKSYKICEECDYHFDVQYEKFSDYYKLIMGFPLPEKTFDWNLM